ncbi:MAG: hypothetical protein GY696_05455, partial [Gammaproteobacteria bacterium]|nr:hypothetical protein [Gammaproteobacteria bacterium]
MFYVTAMVVPRITGNVSGMSPAAAKAEFGIEEKDLDSIYERRLDIIIGISNPVIFPWELKRTKNAYLWRSLFGCGFVASGSSSPVNEKQKCIFATIKSVIKAAELFFAAENLGISAPKRCNRCLKCTECDFYMIQISYQESQEAAAIAQSMTYDAENKKWTVTYPKYSDPGEVLSNNISQAITAHHKLFKRLEQKGAVAAFDAEIQDDVNRGVWHKATAADLEYEGPVNYIVLTEAFKE